MPQLKSDNYQILCRWGCSINSSTVSLCLVSLIESESSTTKGLDDDDNDDNNDDDNDNNDDDDTDINDIFMIMIVILMITMTTMIMIMMVSYRSHRGRPEPDQGLRAAVGPADPGLHEGRETRHLPREDQERSRHEERPARHIQGRCWSSARLCCIQNFVKSNYAFFLSRQNHI